MQNLKTDLIAKKYTSRFSLIIKTTSCAK